MLVRFMHWLRKHYFSVVGSIAFYPALIALSFLTISILMLEVDLSNEGQQLKLQSDWIRLRDADTARSIVSTITAGIISLTVFSFSMVMIVLNQAAAYMSNRILGNLIGSRAQQITLGIYIGTIVYALFLLTTIRDIDSGTNIPSLSIFVLILLTVVDIFIFIYFLHFITQSIKFQTIIHRIAKETRQALEKEDKADSNLEFPVSGSSIVEVASPTSGYYQGCNQGQLVKEAARLNLLIKINPVKGDYLLEGAPFLTLYAEVPVTQEQIDVLLKNLDFYEGQPIDRNPFYGFKQLVEVAIKALSPGINDPSTAVLSLQALASLLLYRLQHPAAVIIADQNNHPWIYQKQYSFSELFYHCIQPIWNYGKKDQYIQDALLALLQQLKYVCGNKRDLVTVEHIIRQVEVERNLRSAP